MLDDDDTPPPDLTTRRLSVWRIEVCPLPKAARAATLVARLAAKLAEFARQPP
jgi:hypothetical protein